MPDSDDVMSEFMINKNKENLGEETTVVNKVDDNFLTKSDTAKSGFNDESVSKEDKSAAMLKYVISMIMSTLILVAIVFSAFFILAKIGPSILSFLRTLVFKLFSSR